MRFTSGRSAAVVRVLADREQPPAGFLLLRQRVARLMKKSSETLAGRVIVEMSGFTLAETGENGVGFCGCVVDSLSHSWGR